jgi:hypothetical protein
MAACHVGPGIGVHAPHAEHRLVPAREAVQILGGEAHMIQPVDAEHRALLPDVSYVRSRSPEQASRILVIAPSAISA